MGSIALGGTATECLQVAEGFLRRHCHQRHRREWRPHAATTTTCWCTATARCYYHDVLAYRENGRGLAHRVG
eukprot:5211338-Heterocapsa_arctica.AAC.1